MAKLVSQRQEHSADATVTYSPELEGYYVRVGHNDVQTAAACDCYADIDENGNIVGFEIILPEWLWIDPPRVDS